MIALSDLVDAQLAAYDLTLKQISQNIDSCRAGLSTLVQMQQDTQKARDDLANAFGSFQAAINS